MASLMTLPRSAPETQGVSSAKLLDFVNALDACEEEIHTFMLVRHGSVIAEGGWKPYSPERLRLLNSVSKTFTSAIVGIAVSEGKLSADDKVVSFFPEAAPAQPDENLAAMTVKHLLTMSSGHAEDTTWRIMDAPDGDWVRAFLHLPVEREPGTAFVYNSGATYMLSAIVQRVAGENMFQYALPRLFEPLGISGATWETCPRGITVGGWGLSVNTEHLAKLGLLYLGGGEWNGRRILPEWWVTESVRAQIANGDGPLNDWAQGYGYQIWRSLHGAYRADGAFGQYAVVMPEQDAVLAVTAFSRNMQAVLDVVWSHLLPALDGGRTELPADDAASAAALSDKLSGLHIAAPAGIARPATEARLNGKRFKLSANELGLDEVGIRLAADECLVEWSVCGTARSVRSGLGSWIMNEWKRPSGPVKYAVSGCWSDEHTFKITMRQIETAYIETYECRLPEKEDGPVSIEYTRVGSVFPPHAVSMTGDEV